MGWSCRAEVDDTLGNINKACVAATGFSNTFEAGGSKYFYELSSREYEDGHATGGVYKMDDASHCHYVMAFKIDPDGKVTNGPKFMKDASGYAPNKAWLPAAG